MRHLTIPGSRAAAAAAAVLAAVTLTAPAAAAAAARHAAPRTASAGAAVQNGGVVLDLYGGIHPFGGAHVDTAGAPYWPGADLARSVSVSPDGSGGWTLDAYGGIHGWGSAAQLATPGYWPGHDLARALVVLPDGHSGYVLDAYGGIHQFGPHAPGFVTPGYWPGFDIARGLAVLTDASGVATGGWLLDGYGGVHPFGSAPAAPVAAYTSGRDVWRAIHVTPDGGVYAVGRWGVVSAPHLSPDWAGYSDWGAWDAGRDIALLSAQGGSGPQPVSQGAQQMFTAASAPLAGVTLDLSGGLHPFGVNAVNTAGAPYWQGADIARSLSVLPDGSGGWTLDAFGGIHPWGAAPSLASPAYWPGFAIARALVVLPDRRSGYLLDGYGGLHPFGPNAPAFSTPNAYWPGYDIARGVAVTTGPSGAATGGWILDAFGGLHPFGAAPAQADPATYYPGKPVWQQLHLGLTGRLYAVGRFGITSAPDVAPTWTGYSDFGAWDAIRDVALYNPLHGGGPQPASAAAKNAFFLASSNGLITDPTCGAFGVQPPATGQFIVISLECQRLSAYQNGQLVLDTLVTTGRPALATERGWTHVLRKNHPWLMVSDFPPSSPYWYYPTWVQWVTWIWPNGTGIHDAAWEPDSALGPGSENGPYASHGCVHVTAPIAEWMYYWAQIGSPVLVA